MGPCETAALATLQVPSPSQSLCQQDTRNPGASGVCPLAISTSSPCLPRHSRNPAVDAPGWDRMSPGRSGVHQCQAPLPSRSQPPGSMWQSREQGCIDDGQPRARVLRYW